MIDNLLARDESIQTAIAFHYCDYSDISTLTACNIFGTLVKQMLNAVEIPTALEQLIDRYYAHGTRTPDNQEVFNVLVETLKLFSKVHLVIDGLDECQKEECAVVLSSMKKLMTSDTPVVKIFLSSREEAYITSSLNAHQVIHVTKEIISPDIALFITEAVDERLRSREMVVHSQPLIQEIITGLVEGAQGMYDTQTTPALSIAILKQALQVSVGFIPTRRLV